MVFKITVLGDGGVGKTALTVQVSVDVTAATINLSRSRGLCSHLVYNVFLCRDI